MDESENSNPDATATGEDTSSAADSNAPGFVTADELQSFGKSLMGDIRKTMAGMIKSQPQPQTPAAKPAAAKDAPPDINAAMAEYRKVEKALIRTGLSDDQTDLIRTLIETQKPDDIASFVADKAKLMGPAATGTPTPEPEQKTAPNPNPTSDRGAPGMTATLESDDVPVWKWSQEKVDRFIKEKGYREFAAVMKKRLPKDLHGVQFQIPRS